MFRSVWATAAILGAIAVIFSGAANAQAAPSNDLIQNATSANSGANSGLGFTLIDESNTAATDDKTSSFNTDTNPPNNFNRALDQGSIFGQRGVWYRWKSAVSQPMIIEITRAEGQSTQAPFDPTLVIFEHADATFDPSNGAPPDLDEIARNTLVVGANDDRSSADNKPQVRFTAQQGYEYWILVGGYNQSQGVFDIQSRPAFDDLQTPFDLSIQTANRADQGQRMGQFSRLPSFRTPNPSDPVLPGTNSIHLSSHNATDNAVYIRFRPTSTSFLVGFILEGSTSGLNRASVTVEQLFTIARTSENSESKNSIDDAGQSTFVPGKGKEDFLVGFDCDFVSEMYAAPAGFTYDACFELDFNGVVRASNPVEVVLKVALPSGVENFGVAGGSFNFTQSSISPTAFILNIDNEGNLIDPVTRAVIPFQSAKTETFNLAQIVSPNQNDLDGAYGIDDYPGDQMIDDWLQFPNGNDLRINGPEEFDFKIDVQKLAAATFAEVYANIVFRGYERSTLSAADCPDFPQGFVSDGVCYQDTNPSEIVRTVIIRPNVGTLASGFAELFEIGPSTSFSFGESSTSETFELRLRNSDNSTPGIANFTINKEALDWLEFESSRSDCDRELSCAITLTGNKTYTFTLRISTTNPPSSDQSTTITVERTDAGRTSTQTIQVSFDAPSSGGGNGGGNGGGSGGGSGGGGTIPGGGGGGSGGGGGCTVAAPGADGDPTLLILMILAGLGLTWRKLHPREAIAIDRPEVH